MESMWYDSWDTWTYNYREHGWTGNFTDVKLVDSWRPFGFDKDGSGRPGTLGSIANTTTTSAPITWGTSASLFAAKNVAATRLDNRGIVIAGNDDHTLWVNREPAGGGSWNLGPGAGWHNVPNSDWPWISGWLVDMEATNMSGSVVVYALASGPWTPVLYRGVYTP
jgi:hypothetical protein